MSDDERVTITVAAKALGVTPRTVQRHIKSGKLTAIKEGHRIYVLSNELRTLRHDTRHAEENTTTTTVKKRYVVTLDRDRYEALLVEMGELRARSQHLLEYVAKAQEKEQGREQELAVAKGKIQLKNDELSQAQARIQILETELEHLKTKKRSWWRRVLGG